MVVSLQALNASCPEGAQKRMKEEIGYVIVWEKSNDDNLEDAALRG